MKKLIIVIGILGVVISCKKNGDINTEYPVKYYFKIAPISDNGSKNDSTTYKLITVD